MSLRFALMLLTGCVPVLTSPAETGLPSLWSAPENAWSSSEPPGALEGEGFGVGQVAPDVRLLDQNGHEVSLWQFYGSVILIDVSTMWCAPCQKLADEVCSVHEDYADQGFAYLTLLPENELGQVPTRDDLVEWATDHDIGCAPVLADDQGWGLQLVPDSAYPAITVIDRDMVVVEDRVEPAEDAVIRAMIEDLL